jgi:hypothetical protein
MTELSIGSMELQIDENAVVSVDRDVADNAIEENDSLNQITADASLNVKVSDLWGTAPLASANLTVNTLDVHTESSLNGSSPDIMDIEFTDQSASAYYDGEYAYFDFSGAPDVFSQIFGSSSAMPTKMKSMVGPVPTESMPTMSELAFPDSQIEEITAQLLPVLEMLPNLAITTVGSELRLVYSITSGDLPELVRSFLLTTVPPEVLSSANSSELDAMLDEMVTQITSMIELTTFEVEVRINTVRNIISYIRTNVDVTITSDRIDSIDTYDPITYEYIGSTALAVLEVIDIDSEVTIQLLKFNEAVTVTLPSDLGSYTDMSSTPV